MHGLHLRCIPKQIFINKQTGKTAIHRLEWTAVGLLLLLQAAVLVSLAWQTGVTIDEPSHILSARLWWTGEDHLRPGDLPPLIKIAGGWVPWMLGVPIPYDSEAWKRQSEWDTALEMMSHMSGRQIRETFSYSRLPLLVFPLLCTTLLWLWTRRIFSPWTGVLVAALYAFSPTALGHGALFKNDIAATFSYLLFWYCAWRFWSSPGFGNTAIFATALLIASLAKMSMLVLIPIAFALLVARFATLRPVQLRLVALCAAVMILIPLAGINAAWQFDSRPLTKADWDPWKSNPNVPDAFIFVAQTVGRLPTPPQLWYAAVSLLDSNATEKAVYMLGRVHDGGHPLYFLIALAYKVPVPVQLLIVAGFAITLHRLACGRVAASHVFWLAPPVLYFALASLSSLQLGVRLVLPAMVFLMIFAGVALEWSRSHRWSAAICAALLCWLSVRMIDLYPRYISYFNSWSGGPENAINLLTDSNLDWGQDLRTLAQVIDREQIPKIRLSYFGTDNPFAHIPEDRIQLLAPPWSPDLVRSRRLAPEPGFYAVSATLLTGQFFPREYRDYYAEFRQRKPFTRAGNSIYLYKIP